MGNVDLTENENNRFQNLDGIEDKIVNYLIDSQSSHARNFWRLLKYDSLDALSQPNLTRKERKDLVWNDNGESTNKRVFLAPFIDDAWQQQCASVYIYVDEVIPTNHLLSKVIVTVETVVHSKISNVSGNGDPYLNPDQKANPNDSDDQGNIVVAVKNRATVLLKSILAELSGVYFDGVGYLQFTQEKDKISMSKLSLWNSKSYYGHVIKFVMDVSGTSNSSDIGF